MSQIYLSKFEKTCLKAKKTSNDRYTNNNKYAFSYIRITISPQLLIFTSSYFTTATTNFVSPNAPIFATTSLGLPTIIATYFSVFILITIFVTTISIIFNFIASFPSFCAPLVFISSTLLLLLLVLLSLFIRLYLFFSLILLL